MRIPSRYNSRPPKWYVKSVKIFKELISADFAKPTLLMIADNLLRSPGNYNSENRTMSLHKRAQSGMVKVFAYQLID